MAPDISVVLELSGDPTECTGDEALRLLNYEVIRYYRGSSLSRRALSSSGWVGDVLRVMD